MNKPKSELYIYELNLPVYIIENICKCDVVDKSSILDIIILALRCAPQSSPQYRIRSCALSFFFIQHFNKSDLRV